MLDVYKIHEKNKGVFDYSWRRGNAQGWIQQVLMHDLESEPGTTCASSLFLVEQLFLVCLRKTLAQL